MRVITRENLRGLWAAVTTPLDDDDRLDEGVLRENIRRLAAAGVDGIYTTDADGEFYALELDEFKRLVDIFGDECAKVGAATQVGITWCNTAGMLDRLRHAAERGVLGAHVGHPFYMPMTPSSYAAFWEDVQGATPEGFALIHYNTPKVHNYRRGSDYTTLARDVPSLVGTKHVSSDVSQFCSLVEHAPELSHFCGEHVYGVFGPLGARGIYSWFANFNPSFLLEWIADVEQGRLDEALRKQHRFHAFCEASVILHEDGNDHAIVGKALSSVSPFLLHAGGTRRPYLPVREEVVEEWRRIVEERFPDLLWPGW